MMLEIEKRQARLKRRLEQAEPERQRLLTIATTRLKWAKRWKRLAYRLQARLGRAAGRV